MDLPCNLSDIKIRGAKTHNLKNINVNIKRNSITCLTGPSGSGKTSLAFHTLFTESKRRFLNSFPSEIKFFWDIPQTVDVDVIAPVLPVWGLAQHNPVVGSRTVISDLINLTEKIQKLFFLQGHYTCPIHKKKLLKNDFWVQLKNEAKEYDEDDVLHFFSRREFFNENLNGPLPARSLLSEKSEINLFQEDHEWWELFRGKKINIQKVLSKNKKELPDPSKINEIILFSKKRNKGKRILIQSSFKCKTCDYSLESEDLSLEQLSPFNALGACKKCKGHGMMLVYDKFELVREPHKSLREKGATLVNYSKFSGYYESLIKEAQKKKISIDKPINDFSEKEWSFLYEGSGSYPGFNSFLGYLEKRKYKKNVRIYIRRLQKEIICTDCEGTRIAPENQSIRINWEKETLSYKEIYQKNLSECLEIFKQFGFMLAESSDEKGKIKTTQSILGELKSSLKMALELGLGRLRLLRKVKYLSSGEYQRSLLAKIVSFKGSGSLFIFDEPSLGLSVNDQKKFLKIIKELRKQGNTILVIDHSEFIHKSSDEIIELGPGAGADGGEVLYQGPFKVSSLKYKLAKVVSKKREEGEWINLKEARIYDLEKRDISIPLGGFSWVHGDSGKGKSSFLIKILANLLNEKINGNFLNRIDFSFKKFEAPDLSKIENLLVFDVKNTRGNARSTVGTATGFSPFIRSYFSRLQVSKSLALKDGHFSPNSPLGRCLSCGGSGLVEIDMNFLEDIKYVCTDCNGKKLKPLYAGISDGELTVHEAFNLTFKEVFNYFNYPPKLKRIAEYIKILNLDYLTLNRSLDTLSGGERQRFKLLAQLQTELNNSILFFENLSFGLGNREVVKICEFLHKLMAMGNTIVVIDQNPMFGKFSNYSIKF